MKIKVIISSIFIIIIICITMVFGINYYVKLSTKKSIINDNYPNDYDAILVLGAGVWGSNPSPILRDRLDSAINLYKNNVASKIIMSGDHGRDNYDEVNIMKKYAIDSGVKSEDIFMDHAGFSTYDSVYRAKEVFDAKKIIIVTQEYHLFRALYIAKKLDIKAVGVRAIENNYSGQTYRELREILARDKDFIKCIFKPEPTYLGEVIPVSGNGDITNDKEY